eukprot:UN05604
MTQYEHVSVKFTVEPQVLTQQQRPCVIYQEIKFTEAINIEFITFRNFYCAFVTIHKYNDKHETNKMDEWITILSKHQLMENGHFENDAQDSHIIHNSQFIKNESKSDETNKTSALRFYLIQPSSNWTSFGLRDLMCYTLIKKQSKHITARNVENKESHKIAELSKPTVDNPKKLNIHRAALLFRQLANDTET